MRFLIGITHHLSYFHIIKRLPLIKKGKKEEEEDGRREEGHLQKDVITPLILRSLGQKVLSRKIRIPNDVANLWNFWEAVAQLLSLIFVSAKV